MSTTFKYTQQIFLKDKILETVKHENGMHLLNIVVCKNRLFWFIKYGNADNVKWKQNVNNILSRKKNLLDPDSIWSL